MCHSPANLLAQPLEGAKSRLVGVEYTLRYLIWGEKTSLVSAIHVLENLLPAGFGVLAATRAHGRGQLLIVEKPFGKRYKLVDVARNKSGPSVMH
jgi:hypothetical protein